MGGNGGGGMESGSTNGGRDCVCVCGCAAVATPVSAVGAGREGVGGSGGRVVCIPLPERAKAGEEVPGLGPTGDCDGCADGCPPPTLPCCCGCGGETMPLPPPLSAATNGFVMTKSRSLSTIIDSRCELRNAPVLDAFVAPLAANFSDKLATCLLTPFMQGK